MVPHSAAVPNIQSSSAIPAMAYCQTAILSSRAGFPSFLSCLLSPFRFVVSTTPGPSSGLPTYPIASGGGGGGGGGGEDWDGVFLAPKLQPLSLYSSELYYLLTRADNLAIGYIVLVIY